MSGHLLAARRYQRAVPVLPGEPVRGGRFSATCQARLGLPVGSTSVYRLPATLGDLTLEVDRGIEIPIDFHDDHRSAGVGQNPGRPAAMPVPTRPDLGHDLVTA